MPQVPQNWTPSLDCKSNKPRVGTRSRKAYVLEADRKSSGSGDESDKLGAILAGIHKVAQGGSIYQKLIMTLKIKGRTLPLKWTLELNC